MRRVEWYNVAAIVAAVIGIAVAVACRGDEVSTNADYVAGEDSTALVTTELQAAARQMFGEQGDALLHGVTLTMQKYDRDMATANGRREWHGRMIREEISTNALCKVEVYSNEVTGAIWRYRVPFAPKPMVSKRNATVYRAATNGVPARLAAIRAKRAAELNAGVVTTNIVTEVK